MSLGHFVVVNDKMKYDERYLSMNLISLLHDYYYYENEKDIISL